MSAQRCPALHVEGGRCAGLAGHGGPHYANASERDAAFARWAAQDLSATLGVPCTDVAVGAAALDPQAQWGAEVPEAAARDLADAVRGAASNARDRMLAAVLGWIRQTEVDWEQRRNQEWPGMATVDIIDDLKAQRDAELAELFARIGAAL